MFARIRSKDLTIYNLTICNLVFQPRFVGAHPGIGEGFEGALQGADGYAVAGSILAGVLYALVVDVDGEDGVCASLGGEDAEDARAAAVVEHAAARQVALHEGINHHAGGLVVACAERTMRDDNHVHGQLLGGVFALPNGIPILVGAFLHRQ